MPEDEFCLIHGTVLRYDFRSGFTVCDTCEAIEINGPPCPACGAGMCEHFICDNFCNNDGVHCHICFSQIGADNLAIAERNASVRAMTLLGKIPDDDD